MLNTYYKSHLILKTLKTNTFLFYKKISKQFTIHYYFFICSLKLNIFYEYNPQKYRIINTSVFDKFDKLPDIIQVVSKGTTINFKIVVLAALAKAQSNIFIELLKNVLFMRVRVFRDVSSWQHNRHDQYLRFREAQVRAA